jgi:2-dehydropantoate 2-reductase
MKIAILGTGAMGSVYAALLADAGNEVWAVDAWPEHVAAMRDRGLRVEGASGDRTVRVNATREAADAGPCDLVIIATKARDVKAAAESAKPLVRADTVVLSIQNGLGGPDATASVLGRERVAVGVVGGFGASMRGPGHAHHNGMELVRLGELAGPVTPRLEAIAEIWRAAGFRVKCFDDIDQLVWEKLICNVCFSGTCAVTERTVGEVMDDPDAWRIASGCAREAYAVARGRRIKLSFDDSDAYVRDFGSKIPNARPSMLLDHLARRRSEIDAINGAIPPAAQSLGLSAPYNEVISGLVRTKERRLGFA